MTNEQKKALQRLALKVQRQSGRVTRSYVVMKDGTVEMINKGKGE